MYAESSLTEGRGMRDTVVKWRNVLEAPAPESATTVYSPFLCMPGLVVYVVHAYFSFAKERCSERWDCEV